MKRTSNQVLLSWVEEMARLCQPDKTVWCDGSEREYQDLCAQMVKSGTLTKLDEKKRPHDGHPGPAGPHF